MVLSSVILLIACQDNLVQFLCIWVDVRPLLSRSEDCLRVSPSVISKSGSKTFTIFDGPGFKLNMFKFDTFGENIPSLWIVSGDYILEVSNSYPV